MKNLSPQKQKLYDLYKDQEWHCSNEITPLFIRDHRKRLSEMRREGFTFESMVCDGRCGVKHAANVHMYRLKAKPQKKVWVYEFDPVRKVRVPKEVMMEV